MAELLGRHVNDQTAQPWATCPREVVRAPLLESQTAGESASHSAGKAGGNVDRPHPCFVCDCWVRSLAFSSKSNITQVVMCGGKGRGAERGIFGLMKNV